MKTIKVKFVDFYAYTGGDSNTPRQIQDILLKYYKLELSDTPDFLFYSVFGADHVNYDSSIKILHTFENVQPDFNYCDYAMGFANNLQYPGRYTSNLSNINDATMKALMNPDSNIFLNKEKFCCFLYSNFVNASQQRTTFFHQLSQYKKVDSGGEYLNNLGYKIPEGHENTLNFQKQYKFAIAFENVPFEGYTTEKLINPKLVGAVPIYYGNADVAKVFNPKAFINCHDYDSFEDVIKQIEIIDNNPALFEQYQKTSLLYEDFPDKIKNLEEFLCNIIETKTRQRPFYSPLRTIDSFLLSNKTFLERCSIYFIELVGPYLSTKTIYKIIKKKITTKLKNHLNKLRVKMKWEK